MFSLIWFLFFYLRYLLEFKGKGEKSGIGVQDFSNSSFIFFFAFAFCPLFTVKNLVSMLGWRMLYHQSSHTRIVVIARRGLRFSGIMGARKMKSLFNHSIYSVIYAFEECVHGIPTLLHLLS